ncbi:MAG TPA: universal stress protein [Brumimicrobium sp.]|nr:universal stress protein [Brumimicrobium sp.]
MNTEMFIVPYDFTSVGDAALKYALYLAKPNRSSIMLLHIISSEEKKKDALERLEGVISRLDLEVGDSTVAPKVSVGNIFDDIPKIANESKASLIIMGTHGAVGMQKLFGSYAMKVISSAKVPFLVVQDGIDNRKIEKILVPITMAKESLQIIHIACKIAIDFNSKIQIISEKQNDPILSSRLEIYLKVVKKQIEEMGVEYDVELLKLKKSFQKSIVDYATRNNCDMIAVAHYTESIIPQLERFTQGLITNDKNIPCLIVNSKNLNSFYF